MAKLFKEITFAKFKAEGTHELNKIYFIKDKGMMFYGCIALKNKPSWYKE